MSLPIPFQGTDKQRRRNHGTHRWHTLDGTEFRCLVCDAKPGHVAADYPCGQEPPRTGLPLGKIPYETAGTGIVDPAYDEGEPEPVEHGWGF